MTKARRTLSFIAIWLGVFLLAVLLDAPISRLVDTYQPIGQKKKAFGVNLIKMAGDFRYLVIVFIAAALVHRSRWRGGVMLLISSLLSGLFYTSKWILGRQRPNRVLEPFQFHYFTGGLPGILNAQYLSFPSGHACLSFAAASALGTLFPRWRWAYFSVAVFVCIERVLEGAHYPSDVVAGAALGLLATRLALKLADRWFGVDWRTVRPPESAPAAATASTA